MCVHAILFHYLLLSQDSLKPFTRSWDLGPQHITEKNIISACHSADLQGFCSGCCRNKGQISILREVVISRKGLDAVNYHCKVRGVLLFYSSPSSTMHIKFLLVCAQD